MKTIKAADDLPNKARNNLPGRTVSRGSGYADTGYEKTGLLKKVINNADVICATCIGSRHDHLRHLDPNSVGLILMDEASQASELESLVPLTAFPCSQIIFIGDQISFLQRFSLMKRKRGASTPFSVVSLSSALLAKRMVRMDQRQAVFPNCFLVPC